MLKNFFLGLFAVGLIVLGAWVHFLKFDVKRMRKSKQEVTQQQRVQEDSLHAEMLKLQERLQYGDSATRQHFLSFGIDDPKTFLLNSLQDTYGNATTTMYPDSLMSDVQFLKIDWYNTQWTTVTFKENEQEGQLLMAYKLYDSENVQWKILDKLFILRE